MHGHIYSAESSECACTSTPLSGVIVHSHSLHGESDCICRFSAWHTVIVHMHLLVHPAERLIHSADRIDCPYAFILSDTHCCACVSTPQMGVPVY